MSPVTTTYRQSSKTVIGLTVAMLAAGGVPVDELVTSRRPLADAADCFAELRRPATGELKILLVPR